jgi:hypothetical protein
MLACRAIPESGRRIDYLTAAKTEEAVRRPLAKQPARRHLNVAVSCVARVQVFQPRCYDPVTTNAGSADLLPRSRVGLRKRFPEERIPDCRSVRRIRGGPPACRLRGRITTCRVNFLEAVFPHYHALAASGALTRRQRYGPA